MPDRHCSDWHLVINTAKSSPHDIYPIDEAPLYTRDTILATGRSMIVMVAKATQQQEEDCHDVVD